MIEKTLKAGEPFVLSFRRKQSGVNASIAGIAARIELRVEKPDGKVIAYWEDDSPELTRDDGGGLVVLTLAPSFTNQLKFKVAYTDLLLLTDPNGLRSDLVKINLHRGATRGLPTS